MSLAGVRYGGAYRPDWRNLSLPRVRLYDGDSTELLVSVCVGDAYGDPFVGVDFYVTGRLGAWLSGRLWERRRRRAAATIGMRRG